MGLRESTLGSQRSIDLLSQISLNYQKIYPRQMRRVDRESRTSMNGKQLRTISEVWTSLQKGQNLSVSFDFKNSRKKLFSFEIDLPSLPDNIAPFVKRYRKGDYLGLLRSLEQESPELAWVAILKVLCLLRLAEKGETIGENNALEFLRDRVVPQVKQIRAETGIPELYQYSQWLERFCLGYELPNELWEEP